MSVNYKAFIGLGYIVNSEQKADILNHCLATVELEDEFICLNGYTNGPLYFLGEEIESIEEGCFSFIDIEFLYEESWYKEIKDKYGMFLEYLETDPEPRLFVCHQVS